MTNEPAPTTAPPGSPPARAGQPGKWRIYLVLGAIVVVLGVVLWAVRDNQAAGDLAVGTCFDVPSRETGISTVTKRECTEAHDAEVFHSAEYAEDAYPISLSLDRFIDEQCVPAFTAYLGDDAATEDLSIGYFYPERDTWDSGDRTFTCYVARADKSKLNQSLRVAADS